MCVGADERGSSRELREGRTAGSSQWSLRESLRTLSIELRVRTL